MMYLMACDPPAAHPAAAPTRADSLMALKTKFKHEDLREFSVNTSELEYYETVDSNTYNLIFQEGDRTYDRNGSRIDYYHSWQNRDTNFIEFTMITFDEGSYCTIIRYYVFDKQGKFISKFDLAASCGDGGWSFYQTGRQIDKTHFSTESVESESDLGETIEKVEGDTTRHTIQLLPTGLFSQKQIAKKHFVREERPVAPTISDTTVTTSTPTDTTPHEP
ncbi:hypothetical protein [Paraflavitalea pollutisoli]|uniref:hypothetical protein n=1 Tax=Paraflavitalea pollutisoli TaxID=3034143 RepID=UPI0023EDA032|nr:hypothetical protein [Paraflavitalea sp. H1-2-19X]